MAKRVGCRFFALDAVAIDVEYALDTDRFGGVFDDPVGLMCRGVCHPVRVGHTRGKRGGPAGARRGPDHGGRRGAGRPSTASDSTE